MTDKQLHDPFKIWRATVALALFSFVFAFAFGAIAAPGEPNIIICAGGVYCDAEVRQPCLESGESPALCDSLWYSCVLDACPQ